MVLSEIKGQKNNVVVFHRIVTGELRKPLLLVGPDGIGKRFSIRHLTQELFCGNSEKNTSCGCSNCYQLEQGLHPDFMCVSSVEKDIGIDTIRSVIEFSETEPSTVSKKVLVLDGVDKLTEAASNAILKTLEEPPSNVLFFLLAESLRQVKPTIRSRCGRIDFSPLPESEVFSVLSQYERDTTRAMVLTRLSQGSIGYAIKLWGSGKLTMRDKVLDILKKCLAKDIPSVFLAIQGIEKDLNLVLFFLQSILTDVQISFLDPTRISNLDRAEDVLFLQKSFPFSKWCKLQNDVFDLCDTWETTPIQIGFHLKSLLTSTFTGI
jgi:DNA polymerase III delta' subunit